MQGEQSKKMSTRADRVAKSSIEMRVRMKYHRFILTKRIIIMNGSDGGISSYAVSGLEGANQILTAHHFDWPLLHLWEDPAQFIRVVP